ncbi:MAG: AMP-binding protein, partial [bacterium]|nr:AMP-binding protein [bacterium]
AIPMEGEPDLEKLEKTIIRLIRRHESLQTSFHIINDEPVQVIHNSVKFNIDYFETDAEPTSSKNLHTNRNVDNGLIQKSISEIQHSFNRSFDLSQAPLLRVALIKHGETGETGSRYLLLVDMHHIISDGISHEIVQHDFNALYMGNQLPPLRIQYKDYSQWQHSKTEKQKLKQQEAYWLKQFDDEIPLLDLPLDYTRPALQDFEGNSITFGISPAETDALKKIVSKVGATSFMLLLSTFYLLLSRLTRQDDIIVGTPVAGRRHADLEKIIGMFVNTLVLRNYPSEDKTVMEFLKAVKARTLAALENQDYPFEDLVELVSGSISRDMARNPLFDVMFTFDEQSKQQADAPAYAEVPGKEPENAFEYRISKFDLTLGGIDTGREFLFNIEYCTRLFKKETIEGFARYFKQAIRELPAKIDAPLASIQIVPEQEKQRILYDFNQTAAEYPREKTIHRLFAEQAKTSPDYIAVIAPAARYSATSDTTFLTYRKLDEQTDHVAALLRSKGIGPGCIAGLMLNYSMNIIIGILGILKSGAAYLPISPELPPKRITFLLED